MTVPEPRGIDLADGDWLRRLARSLIHDPHRADDAVQDTLVAALEGRHGAGRPGRGWLATVLRNALRQDHRSRVRRANRERRASRDERVASSHELAERLELQSRIVEALRGLAEPYREALVLRFFDALPPREIARRLDAPVKTVHTRIERGIDKLRARLDREYGGDRGTWASALLPLMERGGRGVVGALVASTGIQVSLAIGILAAVVLVSPGLFGPGDPDPAVVGLAPLADAEPQAETVPTATPAPTGDARVAGETPIRLATESADAPPTQSELPEVAVVVTKIGTGEPVVSVVKVESIGTATPRVRETLNTDASGYARVSVPAGVELRVRAAPRFPYADHRDPVDNRQTTIGVLEPGELRRVELTLRHGNDTTFYGLVVDGDGDRPLAGAEIRAFDPTGSDPLTTGDAEGRFEIEFPSWRPTSIAVASPGFGPLLVELGSDTTRDQPFVVRLFRAASVEALVTEHSGAPANDHEVRLWTTPRELAEPRGARPTGANPTFRTTCDAEGRALVDGLPPRVPLRAEIWRGSELIWRAREPLVFEPGEARRIEWDLGAGTRVFGTLADRSGRPVPDRELWIFPVTPDVKDDETARYYGSDDAEGFSFTLRTDSRGNYSAVGVGRGAWWIGPAPPRLGKRGDDIAAFAIRIDLAGEETGRRIDLTAHRDLWISGRVLDPSGRPRSARVHGSREHTGGWVSGVDAGAGRFRVGPLAPGIHNVGAVATDSQGRVAYAQAEAGETDVVVRLDAGSTVSGRVVDAYGEAQDAHVALVFADGGSWSHGTGGHGEGVFRFHTVSPGAYSIRASTPDGRIAVRGGIAIASGESVVDLVLELQPGVRTRLELAGVRESARVALLSGGVLVNDFTLRRGQPHIAKLPPGPALLQLYAGGGIDRDVLEERAIDAVVGELEEVLFDVDR